MKDLYQEPECNVVDEARRYVENAKDILNDKGKLDIETQSYRDKKYVRIAGNTLWNGMLLILDAVFDVKAEHGDRPGIKDYKKVITGRDKKLLTYVNMGYDVMHLAMGYDGNQSKETCSAGFRLANAIIDRCAMMLV